MLLQRDHEESEGVANTIQNLDDNTKVIQAVRMMARNHVAEEAGGQDDPAPATVGRGRRLRRGGVIVSETMGIASSTRSAGLHYLLAPVLREDSSTLWDSFS